MSVRAVSGLTGKVRAGGGVGAGQVASSSVVTWNPADKGASVTLSNGDLTVSCGSTVEGVRATTGKSTTGVWQFEVRMDIVGTQIIGLTRSTVSLTGIQLSNLSFLYKCGSGQKITNNTYTAFGTILGVNDILGVVFDAGAGTVSFYKNGVLQGGGVAFSGITGTMFPVWSHDSGSTKTGTANFGATAFAYPIGGASAWNT